MYPLLFKHIFSFYIIKSSKYSHVSTQECVHGNIFFVTFQFPGVTVYLIPSTPDIVNCHLLFILSEISGSLAFYLLKPSPALLGTSHLRELSGLCYCLEPWLSAPVDSRLAGPPLPSPWGFPLPPSLLAAWFLGPVFSSVLFLLLLVPNPQELPWERACGRESSSGGAFWKYLYFVPTLNC